jgi:hypothetical protein
MYIAFKGLRVYPGQSFIVACSYFNISEGNYPIVIFIAGGGSMILLQLLDAYCLL